MRQCVLVNGFGVKMGENIMLNINTTEKPMPRIGKLNADRYHMQEVYRRKNPVYLRIKRGMDVLLSATALVCLSPVFLATAAAIKIEDKGPVFFSQPRAGKDMKPFRIYKFRSMRTDADEKLSEMLKDNEQTGHAFKIKDDPRITKVGKVIRRFSIDELPQLINIIKGDMSIVGPRPILTFQMEECNQYERQHVGLRRC